MGECADRQKASTRTRFHGCSWWVSRRSALNGSHCGTRIDWRVDACHGVKGSQTTKPSCAAKLSRTRLIWGELWQRVRKAGDVTCVRATAVPGASRGECASSSTALNRDSGRAQHDDGRGDVGSPLDDSRVRGGFEEASESVRIDKRLPRARDFMGARGGSAGDPR